MIEYIYESEKLLAIIIRRNHDKNGIEFFTPGDFSQQLGYMNHPDGYRIAPHIHNPVKRQVQYTNEVLYIKSGRVRIDFYDEHQNYYESRILFAGDVILLAFGGHGFEMLDKCEIIEVKQGPYAGDQDKTRFQAISNDKLKIINS
jgi:mannose-6-phosphate isomerase-like protein (cupin superfamily)